MKITTSCLLLTQLSIILALIPLSRSSEINSTNFPSRNSNHNFNYTPLNASTPWWKRNQYYSRYAPDQGSAPPHIPPCNETQEAEESLVWLIDTLRLYISDTGFDLYAFEQDIGKISHDLAEICSIARHVGPANSVLMKQVGLASKMFRNMGFAMRYLKLFDISDSTETALVHYMIELNVKVLGLYNCHGDLDVARAGYQGTLIGFWSDLHRWDDHFNTLEGVSGCMKTFFERQKELAHETVADLWSQFPPS
ncbi:hypothetical protein JCM33374_g6279 [Metschnikowia sp. JCM 33374]|nr:hypothetical protein JCM33374_g6279 [Metschnikowia sp. JCM 33374]